MGASESKLREDSKDDIVLDRSPDDDGLTRSLRVHLSRLIAYAESADVTLQRQVAERLANEAVKRKLPVCEARHAEA